MNWIMIIFLSTLAGGVSVTTVPFTSHDSCIAAMVAMQNHGAAFGVMPRYACVQQ